MKKRIAIAGGVAEGKSTILDIIKQIGITTISCDDVARDLMQQPVVQRAICQELGEEIDFLNRSWRKRVFQDEMVRKTLEKYLHPMILKEVANSSAQVVEVPLLVEAGWEKYFAHIWVTECPPEVQLRRLMRRPNMDLETAQLIISTQVPSAARQAIATRVINTNVQLHELRSYVISCLVDEFFEI